MFYQLGLSGYRYPDDKEAVYRCKVSVHIRRNSWLDKVYLSHPQSLFTNRTNLLSGRRALCAVQQGGRHGVLHSWILSILCRVWIYYTCTSKTCHFDQWWIQPVLYTCYDMCMFTTAFLDKYDASLGRCHGVMQIGSLHSSFECVSPERKSWYVYSYI